MHFVKIISIGSATLDLFFQSNSLPESKNGRRLSLAYGGKYIADNFTEAIGGGGCNASVSLARQGFEVFFWGKIDKGRIGNKILRQLKKEKVKIDLIERTAKRVTISAILLGKEREKTIIMYRGKNDVLQFTKKVQKTIKNCQWLYFADLALCPKKEKLEWLRFAKKNKVKTFVALSGEEYKKGLNYLDEYFALSDIFILNAYELADIWNKDAVNLDLKNINYAQKLNLPFLIVTYDIHGSYVYTKNEIYYQPIFKVKVADSTGAGDAYGSGFLGKYLKTNDIKQAMIFGAKNASSVISCLSTQKGLLYD